MFSQNDEEKIILEHALPMGLFLDIGAFDGVLYSNTRALALRGWGGTLVEPDPICFSKLMALYGENFQFTLVNALLGSQWRMREFWSNQEAYGTSEWRNLEKWKHEQKFSKIIVPEVPVKEAIVGRFDFVSIDTEGTSVDILKSLDLNALGCNLVCVEYDEHEQAVRDWFAQRNFKIIHKNGENLIAKRMTADELQAIKQKAEKAAEYESNRTAIADETEHNQPMRPVHNPDASQ